MYRNIYVPVDNSDHSNRAIATSLAVGKAFDAKLVGCHVYAARMHDYRFKQMEFTLPEEYLEEAELARQRKIHDSLITMGLELISDCYLESMDRQCQDAGLEFERRMMDGKHSTEILKDLRSVDVDLVVLGALGMGRTRDAQIGSVCQRVVNESDKDVWVVKHLPTNGDGERDTILVGVDGSPEGFGALMTAIRIAQRLGKKIELIAVYDPYLHYAVFKGIVNVLNEKAAKVFRFEEQNQLHEEIIDTGLAEIYQSHLNVAEKMARDEGVEVSKTLLDGKAFQKVLDHARKTQPFLLVVGRVGLHRDDAERGLGSNTENILRLAPCDVLITTSRQTPALDVKAEESIHWTPEAEERLGRAPEAVRGIARTAILRLAIQQGHSVVTSDLVGEAMDRFMPKYAQERTQRLAEALAFEKAREKKVSICTGCHTAALVPDPVRCTTCGGTAFEVVTPELVDRIAAAEGGVEEETTYDGRKLRWTQESRKALRALGDSYQRRRAKARIEKAARGQRLEVISLELAKRFIEEETGVLYRPADDATAGETVSENGSVAETTAPPAPTGAGDRDDGLRLLARDRKNNPFLSRLDWTEKALERILRVPGGFMRDRTQTRIEELAAQRGVAGVDLDLVEEGIKVGLRMMEEMLTTYGGASPEMKAHDVLAQGPSGDSAGATGECPVPASAEPAESAESHGAHVAPGGNGSHGANGRAALPLNEISIMSELDRRRQSLGTHEPT